MNARETRNGWPLTAALIDVVGPALCVTVDPDRGGKMISMRDSTGREWLAPPVHVPPPPRPGDDFLAADMAGWDECAPSIVACTVNGVEIRDHGNLWTARATVDGSTITVVDDAQGVRFQRTMTATSSGVTIDYAATAGDTDAPYLWAAHPQFSAPPGTGIVLPSSVTTVVDVLDEELPEVPWSDTIGSIDSVAQHGYRKVYVHPDEQADWARLVHPDGSWLELRWTSPCDYLGLWFDNAALRDNPIIAIEPATGYFDSLETAVRRERHLTIPAGTTVTWRLEVTPGRG